MIKSKNTEKHVIKHKEMLKAMSKITMDNWQ